MVELEGRTSLSVRKYLIFNLLFSLGIFDSVFKSCLSTTSPFLLSSTYDSRHSTKFPGSVLIPMPFLFSPLQLPATFLLSQVSQQAHGSCNMIHCQPAGQIPQPLTFHGIVNLGFLPWQSCHFFRNKQDGRSLLHFQIP